MHLSVEDFATGLAVRFRAVHRDIGVGDQSASINFAGREGNSDGDTLEDFLAVEHKGLRHQGLDPLSDTNRVTGIAHVFKEDEELVAAYPGNGHRSGILSTLRQRASDCILTSNASPETLCELVDQGITGFVSQTIVNEF